MKRTVLMLMIVTPTMLTVAHPASAQYYDYCWAYDYYGPYWYYC